VPSEIEIISERANTKNAMHGCSSDPCGSVVCQTARDRDALLAEVAKVQETLSSQNAALHALHSIKHGSRRIGDEMNCEWEDYTICGNCLTEYPCATIKIIGPAA